MTRLFGETLRSSNMRLRVMLGRSVDPTEDVRSARTYIPIDDLAEQTRGSTDPMVLALLIGPCANDRMTPKPTCDALELATRWTAADTQNQVAWMALSSVLRERGDLAASRSAFEHASKASTWHDYYDDGARTIAAAIPAGVSPRLRMAMLNIALTTPSAYLLPSSELSAISFHCKEPSLRDACISILDTIARDGGSVMSRSIALSIGKRIGVAEWVTASRRRAADALLGAELRAAPDFALIDESGATGAAGLATAIAIMERRIHLGEIGWSGAVLAESGLSEAASAEWLRQYRAAPATAQDHAR